MNKSSADTIRFRITAPFFLGNRWEYVTWTTDEPNKVAACDAKARTLGAVRYDYNMTDMREVKP